jgi:hypothetical protein
MVNDFLRRSLSCAWNGPLNELIAIVSRGSRVNQCRGFHSRDGDQLAVLNQDQIAFYPLLLDYYRSACRRRKLLAQRGLVGQLPNQLDLFGVIRLSTLPEDVVEPHRWLCCVGFLP